MPAPFGGPLRPKGRANSANSGKRNFSLLELNAQMCDYLIW
jgi:hypothetical protein